MGCTGCIGDEAICFKPSTEKHVGLQGGNFRDYNSTKLHEMMVSECKHICTGMDYDYIDVDYSSVQEDGMWVAKGGQWKDYPVCICFEKTK